MIIEWNIKKKRGNLRPVLSCTITLSEFERNLAVPAVCVTSTIPKPPDAGWNHCWPGQNERGDWSPTEFYTLITPNHRTGEMSERFKLPWREKNHYPEVEESFTRLREAFEAILAQASQSKPLEQSGSLESTAAAKKLIAPAFAAERLLQVVKG